MFYRCSTSAYGHLSVVPSVIPLALNLSVSGRFDRGLKPQRCINLISCENRQAGGTGKP